MPELLLKAGCSQDWRPGELPASSSSALHMEQELEAAS